MNKSEVNYFGKYRNISTEDKVNGIELRWSGHYSCSSQYKLNRTARRYMIGYIEKGVALYGVGGNSNNTIELHSGDMFFCRPQEKQYIRSSNDDPVTYYGTCFSGDFMEEFINRTTLLNMSVANLGLQTNILDDFNTLVEDYMSGRNTLHIMGTLMHLVSSIDDSCVNKPAGNAGHGKNQDIIKTADYLRVNYKEKISIDDLADMSGYSSSRFQYLFRRYYGVSAIEFLINERIRHAKELLHFDGMNINEVAHLVGYDDSYYFSKIFKKHEGVSPKEFRKKCFVSPEE